MKVELFYALAAVILITATLVVTSKRLLRAAVYLMVTLVATAAVYLLMDFYFLAAAQLTLYAGGIIVLIIFSVMLTTRAGEILETPGLAKRIVTLLMCAAGAILFINVIGNSSVPPIEQASADTGVAGIGEALVNTGRNGYALPFEVISILLLAVIIAAVVIARKDGE